MKRIFRLFACLLAVLLSAIGCYAQLYPAPPMPYDFSYGYTFNQYYWYRDVDGYKERKLAKQAALDSVRANIKLLKENTLVVRLKTGSNKIKAIKRQMGLPNTSETTRQKYQSMLDKTVAEVRLENQMLMNAFDSNYTFSRVVFMPDTLASKLKSGVKTGLFLNKNFEIDQSISIPGHFFVAYYGESDYDDNTSVEGINIFDERFEPLKYPFPSFIGRAYIWRFISTNLLGAPVSEHYERLVHKLNSAMEIK